VFFEKAPSAKTYSVWVSPYSDGTGALQLGRDWKEPGGLVTGLRPSVDFYAFVSFTDNDGHTSKPSKSFKFRLKDDFGMK
jgi:hypothetical protein